MADSNLNKMIETAMENIKKIADVNTIIGEPISVSGGTTIIPVSKVSLAFTSGGVDYISKKAPEKPANFGGGSGGGISVLPIAFLVVDKDGCVSLLNVENPNGSSAGDILGTISMIAEKSPGIIEKFSKLFKKDKPEKPTNESGSAQILNNQDMDGVSVK